MSDIENKKIKIPGRLIPATTEGIVVGTDVIIDESLEIDGRTGYTQAELNQKFALGETGPIEPERIEDGSITGNKIAPQTITLDKIDNLSGKWKDIFDNNILENGFFDEEDVVWQCSNVTINSEQHICSINSALTISDPEPTSHSTEEYEDYVFINAEESTTNVLNLLPQTGQTGILYSIRYWYGKIIEDIPNPDTGYYNIAYNSEYKWDASENKYIYRRRKKRIGTEHPGYITQNATLSPGVYIAACYVSIDSVAPFYGTESPTSSFPNGKRATVPNNYGVPNIAAFIQADGIGLSVREILNSGQHYRDIDYPYVAMCHVIDKVPILKIFVVRKNTEVELRFGCLFDHQGTVTGKIYHAALYQYTDQYPNENVFPLDCPESNLKYCDCYTNYKNYIESKLGFVSPVYGVEYPDSECKQAFLDAMNKMADDIGLDSTIFGSPLGSGSRTDCPQWFINKITPSESIANKGYTETGADYDNSSIISYVYTDVNPSVYYYVTNVYLDGVSSKLPAISFWDNNGKYINSYGGGRAENGQLSIVEGEDGGYLPVKIPKSCSKIIITTMENKTAPVLWYASDIQRDDNSIPKNAADDPYAQPPISTHTTAKDLCIFGAITFDKEVVRRMYNEIGFKVHVEGNHPRCVAGMFSYSSFANIKIQYLGIKGGDGPSTNTLCYCVYLRDGINNKNMIVSFLKKIPYSLTAYTFDELFEDGVQAVRTNGQFNFVSALSAAGGYVPDGLYKEYGNEKVGDYIINLGGYNKAWVPYSCTKIMTTLVAVEYGNVSDVVTYIPTDIYDGSGHNNWEEGDKLTLYDALRVMLRNSDNSLAVAIARCVGEKILRNRDNY